MIVIGAGGLASEILPVLASEKYSYSVDNLFFFDNVNKDTPKFLFDKFRVLTSFDEAKEVITTISPEFCLGVGGVKAKAFLFEKMLQLGGKVQTIISPQANISPFGTTIGKGTVILGNAQITSNVDIGKNCLVYMNVCITHDCMIGDYVDISPGVDIAGRCKIGDNSFIGTGTVLIPDITIGQNCFVGAGSVVTKNVPDNTMVFGNPAKKIRQIN